MNTSSFTQRLVDQPLAATVDYYARHLNDHAHAFLKRNGLSADESLRVGFADRTLGKQIPSKQLKAGREIRTKLIQQGILKPNGHETLRGFVTVPLTDIEGTTTGLYGLRVDNKGKDQAQLTIGSGWFNAAALTSFEEIIVCANVLDAWTFHAAGHTNVVAVEGTPLEKTFFHRAKRILLAAPCIDLELFEQTELMQIHFPEGMTVNEYALLNRSLDDALGKRIRAATTVSSPSVHEPADIRTTEPAKPVENHEKPPAQPTASPVPAPIDDLEVEQNETEITIRSETRRWRIRGLERNATSGVMKINLMILNDRNQRFHVDTLDLYHSRSRRVYLKESSEETALSENELRSDLGRVLLKLEELQEQQRMNGKSEAKPIELSEAERSQAMDLLQSENLFDRILDDFDACGIVGERTGKLVGYLAATSRLLDKPLGLMIQSSSAAGKTSLMNAILSFMPDEQQFACSAMTSQSLYYAGNLDLRHKILSIAEEEGVGNASYALKLLQSEGKLSIVTTAKESGTGRTAVERYEVEGPVAMLLTTTASNVDPELMNRLFVVSVDENSEQTAAIQERQRRAHTLDELLAAEHAKQIRSLHQNAQRLLRPIAVVNRYADQLTFPKSRVCDRRDNAAYLSLIVAITVLHQHQREIQHQIVQGNDVEFIEVERSDIALANAIVRAILGSSIDGLPPQTRRLLFQIFDYVHAIAQRISQPLEELHFTRRELREAVSWGQTQLKVHLDRLVEYEYVHVFSGPGRTQHYALRWDGRGREGQPTLFSLTDPATLTEPTSTTPVSAGLCRPISGHYRANIGLLSGHYRTAKTELTKAAKTS